MKNLELFDDQVAHARRTDPDTSKEAAASVKNLTQTQNWILHAFKTYGGMDDEELIVQYRSFGVLCSESGIRTRRAELVVAGKLRDSGKRGRTRSGRKSIIWELTNG
jgi:hypothetical protein